MSAELQRLQDRKTHLGQQGCVLSLDNYSLKPAQSQHMSCALARGRCGSLLFPWFFLSSNHMPTVYPSMRRISWLWRRSMPKWSDSITDKVGDQPFHSVAVFFCFFFSSPENTTLPLCLTKQLHFDPNTMTAQNISAIRTLFLVHFTGLSGE